MMEVKRANRVSAVRTVCSEGDHFDDGSETSE
jgi:hypothetical protein